MTTLQGHREGVGRSTEPPDRAPLELRRLVCAASERIRELDAERCALEEVRASLLADERRLMQRHSSIEEECRDLAASVEAVTRRAASIETEIDAMERQKATLACQDDATRRRLDRLMHEAETLEAELGARRSQAAEAHTSFHSVLGSVLRMDYKLRSHTDAKDSSRDFGE